MNCYYHNIKGIEHNLGFLKCRPAWNHAYFCIYCLHTRDFKLQTRVSYRNSFEIESLIKELLKYKYGLPRVATSFTSDVCYTNDPIMSDWFDASYDYYTRY